MMNKTNCTVKNPFSLLDRPIVDLCLYVSTNMLQSAGASVLTSIGM